MTIRHIESGRATYITGDVRDAPQDNTPGRNGRKVMDVVKDRTTIGFTDCGHDDWRPGIVLDPFAGSGTTLMVATGLGHAALGFDLDPRNVDLARDRVGPMLLDEHTLADLTTEDAS